MVNKIELHKNAFRQKYTEYLHFLNESLKEVNNKVELADYYNYVKDTNELFNNYIDNLNPENSLHLYTLIGGICRYFSEFNWFDDYDFHIEAKYFQGILTIESNYIYSCYHKEKST